MESCKQAPAPTFRQRMRNARKRSKESGRQRRRKKTSKTSDWWTCRQVGRPTENRMDKIRQQNEMNESKISSVRRNLISSVRLCLMSKRTAYTIISFNWITFLGLWLSSLDETSDVRNGDIVFKEPQQQCAVQHVCQREEKTEDHLPTRDMPYDAERPKNSLISSKWWELDLSYAS